MAKFGNFCGKIRQNLGFQMAIFCDARQTQISRVNQLMPEEDQVDLSRFHS